MKLFELRKLNAYHGTSSIKAAIILKSGFDESLVGSKSGLKMSGISFTIDKTIAQEHAEWAVEKFGGEEAIIVIDLSNLNICPGSKITELWNNIGSLEKALLIAKESYDGAQLFDYEEESGTEELEVLIFDPMKIKTIHKL